MSLVTKQDLEFMREEHRLLLAFIEALEAYIVVKARDA